MPPLLENERDATPARDDVLMQTGAEAVGGYAASRCEAAARWACAGELHTAPQRASVDLTPAGPRSVRPKANRSGTTRLPIDGLALAMTSCRAGNDIPDYVLTG